MSRRDYRYESTRCSGGVNQDEDSASLEECSDALNVWRPHGLVETRPGYTGVLTAVVGSATVAVLVARTEDNSGATPSYASPTGAGVLDLSSLVKDQDRWYIGHSAAFDVISLAIVGDNSNATIAKAEYYNGTSWAYLRHVEALQDYHLSNPSSLPAVSFSFVRPGDWATTTVDSQSAYWIRFNIQGTNLDAAVSVDVDNASTGVFPSSQVRGFHQVQFQSGKRYVVISRSSDGASIYHTNFGSLSRIGIIATDFDQGVLSSPTRFTIPSTIAIVPQFSESFIAYDNYVVRHDDKIDSSTSAYTITPATVEDRDFAVGPGAPFDKTLVAQLGSWPECSLTTFFGGRIWAADILGSPYRVRWSAKAPFHKVWSVLSYEDIMIENDNSPITAIHPLGEHMIVFKQDSIWEMVPVGENPVTAIEAFEPVQVVSGLGCVSHHSVQQVRGELIFLSEDGIYAFNGTANVRKVTENGSGSDRLGETMATISYAKRKFASSAHWKSNQVYILSFSTGGAENDTTVVWDYTSGPHGAWWVWDNIDAQHWLTDEGVGDQEILYFGDSNGRLYQFGVGNTDHGTTISSHVETQRFGYDNDWKKGSRLVRVNADNRTRSITCGLSANDASHENSTVSFTDSTEADWDDFSYASGAATDDNWVADRRRRRRADFWLDNDWAKVKLSHSTRNQRMRVSRIDHGFVLRGKR